MKDYTLNLILTFSFKATDVWLHSGLKIICEIMEHMALYINIINFKHLD